MLSKRDFFAMMLMMLALFFIFQFSQVIKAQGNNYDVNEYAGDSADGKESDAAVTLNTLTSADARKYTYDDTVWFVGDRNSETALAVEQWCYYRNYRIEYFDSIPDPVNGYHVLMVVFDTANVELVNKVVKLKKLAETMGSVMVFSGLPDTGVIRENSKIRELFGITEVIRDNIETEGIQMFGGFLLGGETILKANTAEEKKYEDISLNMPWFDTGLGTKTYIVALMDEDDVFPYDFPKLLWRNYFHGAFVYAVNGDYLKGNMGIGFLDAMVYDTSDYSIYPVVNANIVSLTDFPYLANENDEKILRTYSRNVETTLRDVAWPGFVSMTSRSDLRLTGFFTTKYDYNDSAEPDGKYVPFYLQQLKEVGAEAGRSLAYKGNISLEEKIKKDNDFFKEIGINYNFRVLFTRNFDKSMVEKLKSTGFTTGCIVNQGDGDEQLFGYVSDSILKQEITAGCADYSFGSHLLQKSILTSLGYSNVLIDMSNVVWPESVEDEWQNYFDVVYSNMTTYWSDTCGFEKTTASEGDARTRKMLSTSFKAVTDPADPLKINLEMSGSGDCWFVLRTHNAAIESMSSGEYEELEEFVYLLHVNEGTTEIILDDKDDVFRYRNPFD